MPVASKRAMATKQPNLLFIGVNGSADFTPHLFSAENLGCANKRSLGTRGLAAKRVKFTSPAGFCRRWLLNGGSISQKRVWQKCASDCTVREILRRLLRLIRQRPRRALGNSALFIAS